MVSETTLAPQALATKDLESRLVTNMDTTATIMRDTGEVLTDITYHHNEVMRKSRTGS